MGKVRVLIADDDADVRDSLAMFFSSRGHKTSTAKDGREAWEMMGNERPDVCILDIMMPGMTGIDVCRQARQDPELADTPILLLSAKSSDDEIVEGLRAGAWDYVTKPYLNAEIIARAESALRKVQYASENRRSLQLEEFLQSLSVVRRNLRPTIVHLLGELRGLRMNYRPEEDDLRASLDEACRNAGRLLVILDKLKNLSQSDLDQL